MRKYASHHLMNIIKSTCTLDIINFEIIAITRGIAHKKLYIQHTKLGRKNNHTIIFLQWYQIDKYIILWAKYDVWAHFNFVAFH